MSILRASAVVPGAFLIAATIGSAMRTVVLPRAIPSRLTRAVFVVMRKIFRLRAGPRAPYERRDRVMAFYAPLSLLVLLGVWMALVLAGYAAIFWGLGERPARALLLSGSSILTLGFERPVGAVPVVLVFSEAVLGLVLLALLITYLPTLYGAFSRREAAVAALEIRADSPPSGIGMIERHWTLERMDRLHDLWTAWEAWFVDIEETHTSLPSLTFFRSPQPDQSWVTAAGAVLDGASLTLSAVDVPRDVQAEFCIRAGYIALRRIAGFFGIPHATDPAPDEPISIRREEFEEACARLRARGVPLKPDTEQAWKDFSGWRVNYDDVLLALAGLAMAPRAPWSSDRAVADWSPPLFGRLARRLGGN